MRREITNLYKSRLAEVRVGVILYSIASTLPAQSEVMADGH